MTEKIKVKPFNSLPMEQRIQISYYLLDYQIRTINQVLSELKNYIGQIPKDRVLKWQKLLIKELDKYEVEE